MNLEQLVSFASDLVRVPSLSCQEGEVTDRVVEEFAVLGFDEVVRDPFGTAIGIVHGTEPGPTLLLDGHTDTVDVVGALPWEADPFSGRVSDGWLCGRGSADMKGALAGMIHAAGTVDRSSIKGSVVVSASTLEEVLEGAALGKVMERFAPDFVVIGEATELNVAIGGRGRAELHLEVAGVPTHSSAPHLGRNAVLDMAKLSLALEELQLPSDPLLGPAILALTEISSIPFPANSVIPSICRATYDRRLLAGESRDDVISPIREAGRAVGAAVAVEIGVGEYRCYTGEVLTQEKFFPAWTVRRDHWLVQRVLEGLGSSDLTPDTRAYQFCTNAAYSAGIAGVPTVGFGPGKESDAHVVNERLSVEDLHRGAKGYAGIIQSVLKR